MLESETTYMDRSKDFAKWRAKVVFPVPEGPERRTAVRYRMPAETSFSLAACIVKIRCSTAFSRSDRKNMFSGILRESSLTNICRSDGDNSMSCGWCAIRSLIVLQKDVFFALPRLISSVQITSAVWRARSQSEREIQESSERILSLSNLVIFPFWIEIDPRIWLR